MRKFVRIDREGDIGTTFLGLSRLAFGKSRYNTIEIFRSSTYGKILFLNNEVMNAEGDEVLYHEPLVHLPMAYIEHPKSAVVLGGGTLNVVREILKYKSIKYIVMIEVDRTVVEKVISNYEEKKSILRNRRLEVVYGDAYKIIGGMDEKFDLVINDAKDLVLYNRGIGHNIFTTMYDRLTPNGVCADVVYRTIYERKNVLDTMRALKKFQKKKFALIVVPTFPGCLHLLTIWGKNRNLEHDLLLPVNKEQRMWIATKTLSINQYYDPRHLRYFFYLPPYLKNVLSLKKNSS